MGVQVSGDAFGLHWKGEKCIDSSSPFVACDSLTIVAFILETSLRYSSVVKVDIIYINRFEFEVQFDIN